MLPDDDKWYAIETCRSSESVLKKSDLKINDIQLVHLLVLWLLVNLQDARCTNKDNVVTVFKFRNKPLYELNQFHLHASQNES